MVHFPPRECYVRIDGVEHYFKSRAALSRHFGFNDRALEQWLRDHPSKTIHDWVDKQLGLRPKLNPRNHYDEEAQIMVGRLNTEQALTKLGFTHRNSLHDRVKAGDIIKHKDGRRNYYLEAELDRYLERKANPEITIEEAHRRAQEAAQAAAEGREWTG